ncbi:hypothetical protein GKO32_32340 [Amycolatopsis sp. RM579]|uniref:Excalibur calcium-binding domain-containing protein n=1 Tax=Amycolatopsis pithecellobii TaxID=664692 RepID=A0A6N7ZA76_9PSEU|nr:hypothetical protein [Amycolatopsis pithecellobii]
MSMPGPGLTNVDSSTGKLDRDGDGVVCEK